MVDDRGAAAALTVRAISTTVYSIIEVRFRARQFLGAGNVLPGLRRRRLGELLESSRAALSQQAPRDDQGSFGTAVFDYKWSGFAALKTTPLVS